jgi:hypothetical protein
LIVLLATTLVLEIVFALVVVLVLTPRVVVVVVPIVLLVNTQSLAVLEAVPIAQWAIIKPMMANLVVTNALQAHILPVKALPVVILVLLESTVELVQAPV